MTSPFLVTLFWYLGALVLLWYASLRYWSGTAFSRVAPFGAIVILMLVTASAVYYDYIDAPIFRVTYIFWAIIIGWTLFTSMRSPDA